MTDPGQPKTDVQQVDWKAQAGKEVAAGKVYFATDVDKLTGNDETSLRQLTGSLTPLLLQHGTRIELRCEGWADPRGNAAHNQDLSKRRCDAVIAFLQKELEGGARKATYTISGKGFGERSGAVDPGQYALERRVDVFCRVTRQAPGAPRVDPLAAERAPWAKRRASLFRKYSLDYPLWRKLGLDALIDEYEMNEEADRPVRSIKPADQPKVLALLQALASPSDFARIRNQARGSGADRVLAEAYGVEYRRAYGNAYRRSPGTIVR